MINDLQEVGELDRRTYIGSSDAAAIMGLGAFERTALSTYLEKLGEMPIEIDAGHRRFLDRRKRFESPIVQMLKEDFDGEIVNVNKRYRDREHSFMAAEVDFEWRDEDGDIQNGEIKTCSPFAFGERQGWGEPGTSDIPVTYACQVMYSLMITGRRRAIVAALVGLDDMKFYRIDRDDETIATLRAESVRFWNEHVLKRIPPPPQTMQDIGRMFNKYKGHPVQLTPAMIKKLAKRAELQEKMRTMKADIADIDFNVACFIADSWGYDEPENTRDDAALLVNGIPVGTWKLAGRNYLDQTALKLERPDIHKQFMRPTTHREFDISKTLVSLYNNRSKSK